MTKRRWLIICIFVLTFSSFITNYAVDAAPLAQLTPFPTPTPGPDGRILYIVQAGDTILRISLISGISVDELRGLNNLAGDNINVGQELLLGLGGPSQVTPTLGPSPTATPIVPTPTQKPGAGNICVLLYNDVNGDAVRQEEEVSIPGGAVSINDQVGQFSETADTQTGSDPTCFEKLLEGEYSVSVAIPDGFNATTASSIVIQMGAGEETYLDFGAQPNSENISNEPITEASQSSPLLSILGGIILLAGLGLGFFGVRMLRGK